MLHTTWSLTEIAKAIIVIIGFCAVIYVIAKACKITIPEWLINLCVIVVAVSFGILAINLIASM